MNLTAEQLAKAKEAKSIEELTALAKAEGVEVSAGEIEKFWNDLHTEGELGDEELDNVAGGYCSSDLDVESHYNFINNMDNYDPRCPACHQPLKLEYSNLLCTKTRGDYIHEGEHYDAYSCQKYICQYYIGVGRDSFNYVRERNLWYHFRGD